MLFRSSFCRTLHKVTLPDSWGLVTNVTSLFQSAYFVTPNMPASWGNITTINNMFAGIRTLRAIALPDSWGLINSIFQVFNSVPSVVKAILPTYRAEYATVFNYVFYLCISLSKIENIEFLGSLLAQCEFTAFIYDCPGITQEISITSLLKRIDITGTVTNKLKISSIRLANQNSLLTGCSPQINVVYTSLQKSALETLFGDIPVGLTSKTVAITGAIGCDAPVSKAAIGTTINSTTVTMSDTSLLSAGMEVYGTGISTAKAVTFTDAGDLVNRTAHGLSNGRKISFSSITSTTGIVVNTPYYVINAAANTFQVSLTLGGSAIALTTNGSGNLIAIPTIVTINAGVSIVIDVPCSATASVTLTAGVLKRSIALLKGWTITN